MWNGERLRLQATDKLLTDACCLNEWWLKVFGRAAGI